ncbi:MAG: hypothetical protein WD176_07075 [Pirellulales bacterium]
MHTVDLLEDVLALATRLGYSIRQEWLGGQGGGGCVVAGRKCLFVDLAQEPADRLDTVVQALRADPVLGTVELGPPLSQLLQQRRAA